MAAAGKEPEALEIQTELQAKQIEFGPGEIDESVLMNHFQYRHNPLEADEEEAEHLTRRQSHPKSADAVTYKTVTENSIDETGLKKVQARSSKLKGCFNMFRAIIGTTILVFPFICEQVAWCLSSCP